jgi:hypothetical protein
MDTRAAGILAFHDLIRGTADLNALLRQRPAGDSKSGQTEYKQHRANFHGFAFRGFRLHLPD